MTLYRQLLLTMLLLFVILFVTAYAVQFNATKTYLAAQQETTVINTVTALGLALTPYLETSDGLGAESVINAIFDGGFYKKIELDLLASHHQIIREHSAPVQGIPTWFTQLHLFSGAKHEAILTSGWLQLGRLSVEGHEGQAAYQLWQVMSQQAFWFGLCFVVAASLLVWALRYLLAPLHAIERQAERVTRHQASSPIPLPNTRELKQLVSAINVMSAKLTVQFQQQAAEVERLRRRAFWDPTSTLGNRAYFMTQVESWLGAGTRGAVLLVSVDMLAQLDQEQGFAARDSMIKTLATQLRRVCQRYGESAISRLSTQEFALLIPEYNNEHLLLLGKELNRIISELFSSELCSRELFSSSLQSVAAEPCSLIGIATLGEQDNASLLLTRADNALNQARMGAPPELMTDNLVAEGVIIESAGPSPSLGRLAWKQLIETALRNDLFELNSQAVLAINGQLLHEELYIGIRTPNTYYRAGSFLALVEQFKLGQQLDLHIIRRALQHLTVNPSLRLAVNLTAYSCQQPEFWQQLDVLLAEFPTASARLLLDLPERVFLLPHSALTASLRSMSASRGITWGIDHFGRHFDLLNQLGELRPAYVKLDYGYSARVSHTDDNGAFLAAVCRAAHQMGAQTIATRVETQSQLALLKTLYVDAYQGFVSPSQSLL